MADDDGDLIDLDDEDGADAEGRAVVLCRVESLGVRFRFVDSVEAALRLAAQHPCETDGCLGGHMVVHRDNGRLVIIADADGDAVRGRFSDALRVREQRRQLRARLGYADRQRRRRAANRATLREDTDDES